MNDDKIATLDLKLQPLCREFLAKGDLWLSNQELWKDYHLLVTQARRDLKTQAGLYSQGRVWNKITQHWIDIDANSIVTHTMNSKHLDGLAFDICLSKPSNPAYWPHPTSTDGKELWEALAEIAEAIGLKSGARWKNPDYDHFEI